MITFVVTDRFKDVVETRHGDTRAMKFYASEAYPVDFPDADVLIMLHKRGLRFKEVPVRMKKSDKKKTMHSGTVPLYYIFKMFLSIFVTLLRKEQ